VRAILARYSFEPETDFFGCPGHTAIGKVWLAGQKSITRDNEHISPGFQDASQLPDGFLFIMNPALVKISSGPSASDLQA
jgi:hypothetical protein